MRIAESVSMRRLRSVIALGLLVAPSLAAQTVGGSSIGLRSPIGPGSSVIQILPGEGGVSFQQVAFNYSFGFVAYTDWGQIVVDPEALRRRTGAHSGFINVFDAGGPKWVVENLSVPLVATRPICRYFDLRPRVEGSGEVLSTRLTVLFSVKPLPNASSVLSFPRRLGFQTFAVQQTVHDAEGAFAFDTVDEDPPPDSRFDPADLLGQPPPASNPPDSPTFGARIGVYQLDQPNVDTAKSQCVPMAYANTLQYLEDRYDAPGVSWRLQHEHVPGYGMGVPCTDGGAAFWLPVPTFSLVANIDAHSRRNLVCDCSSGKGTSTNGFFRYVAAYGASSPMVLTHQGGDPVKQVDGVVSIREGVYPTWEWIYDKLERGRGVYMSYCRFDPEGERTGGHAVRIWGAESYNGKRYLLILDDSSQGCGTGGTSSRSIEVADIGAPDGGPPNGKLNINGLLSRELGGVRAIQAFPIVP